VEAIRDNQFQEQVIEWRRPIPVSQGVAGLQLAVLADACTRGYIKERTWFESPDADYVFSFRTICETLGLSATMLLARVKGGRAWGPGSRRRGAA